MGESLIERLATRRDLPEPRDLDPDELLDMGSFGWLRGVRERSIMLELRFKDGRIVAFSYAWLEQASFDPSHGIKLKFAGHEVIIQGRNLHIEPRPSVQLFSGLVRHRVPWLAETSAAHQILIENKALVIEKISMT